MNPKKKLSYFDHSPLPQSYSKQIKGNNYYIKELSLTIRCLKDWLFH